MKDDRSIEIAGSSNEWQNGQQSIQLDELGSDNYEERTKIKQFNRIDEIELVHRLDKRLLLFAMFGNLVKTLDNTNLGKNLYYDSIIFKVFSNL
jgi:ACS family pantothenate transporter-like MFS transporter